MKQMLRSCALLLLVVLMLGSFAACAPGYVGSYTGVNGDDDFHLEWAGEENDFNQMQPDAEGDNYFGWIPDESNSSMNQEASSTVPEQNGDGSNPFISTKDQVLSTFSADVDTASYSYFRKLVNASYKLPDLQRISSAFRVEEFLNYFKYDVAAPVDGELFGVRREIVTCPWDATTQLMRLTLQAPAPAPSAGNNLVFLIDVSGSMRSDDKLPLLKTAFTYLVGSLGANDTVSIVTYSGKEEVVLEGCSGLESERILTAINSLRAGGSTNGEAGLSEAYRIAEAHMIEGGNNRIIMASDGDLNVGISSAADLKAFVEGKRDRGVYLSILGFGGGNYRDANMEALADNGNGVYYYIDGVSEAEKVFGTDLLGTLYTVARDVKLQIKFDPRYVAAYRLIGYENRALNTEDFDDDTKDAGDVGAGHQVTVCYELKCTPEALSDQSSDWMELSMRYKLTDALLSTEEKLQIGAKDRAASPSEDLRFLCCVIQTVTVLKQAGADGNDLGLILEELNSLDLDGHPDRADFRDLIDRLV